MSETWLRETFPNKDWHRHLRTDGRTDLCDGTPSDCASKIRVKSDNKRVSLTMDLRTAKMLNYILREQLIKGDPTQVNPNEVNRLRSRLEGIIYRKEHQK